MDWNYCQISARFPGSSLRIYQVSVPYYLAVWTKGGEVVPTLHLVPAYRVTSTPTASMIWVHKYRRITETRLSVSSDADGVERVSLYFRGHLLGILPIPMDCGGTIMDATKTELVHLTINLLEDVLWDERGLQRRFYDPVRRR